VEGSRDSVYAVVRALASHQCGPGSIPGPRVICGLISSLLRGFFSGFSGFPPSKNPQHFQIRSATLWRCPLQNSDLFILFLVFKKHRSDYSLFKGVRNNSKRWLGSVSWWPEAFLVRPTTAPRKPTREKPTFVCLFRPVFSTGTCKNVGKNGKISC